MSRIRLRFAANALWSLTVVAYLAEVILLFVNASFSPVDKIGPLARSFADLPFLLTATLGWLILRRQPTNAVGWWVLLAGLSFPLEAAASGFADLGLRLWGPVPITLGAYWVAGWAWMGAQVAIPFILLYYPDGMLPSPRWTSVATAMGGLVLVYVVMFATISGADPAYPTLHNPLGIEWPEAVTRAVFASAGPVIGILLPVLGATSLAFRYRSSPPVGRQQIKFVAWLAGVSIVFFGVLPAVPDLPAGIDAMLSALFTLFAAGTIAAAVWRYRLFDIDRLISQSISYVLVIGVLGLIFAVGVVALPNAVIGTGTAPSPVVAGSTLVVASLFNPLRRRVQGWVDRRFNRARYDAERVTAEFGSRLRVESDLGEIVEGWLRVVDETMRPSALGVWVRP